jgi:anthranilate phosphoribosyltransferase
MRAEIATRWNSEIPMTHIHEAIEKGQERRDLRREEARAVMEKLLSGSVPDADIVSLLMALRDKGEKTAELVGFAEVMREQAAEVLARAGVKREDLAGDGPLLDTCGTGGDGHRTVNLSTATALVVAAAGVRVAKHGNRSISSQCGSADVLEALGVSIELPLTKIPECLDKVGMVFLFAPHLHLAMKHVMAARRSIKTKTVFNLLGPLTNPLGASLQLAGVYDGARAKMMAEALAALGTRRALVVAGSDGLDEITITGPTLVAEAEGGKVSTRQIAPEDFGLPRSPLAALAGADPAVNARLLLRVLEGERSPIRDCIVANAAAAFVVAGRAQGFSEGAEMAGAALDSGAARRTLRALVEFTAQHRK